MFIKQFIVDSWDQLYKILLPGELNQITDAWFINNHWVVWAKED